MNINQLLPKPNKKAQFKLSLHKSIPKESGCYILTTHEHEILYIGLSKNLYNRFQQHLDNPVKTLPTIKGKAVWFHFLGYDTTNLAHLERTWLNQYEAEHGELPVLNKVSSPL
ncbi:MAG: GIY-YIG nuclease family protein [Lachnospiraceae bacterium]|nr:GIY-YIG nuclease family protein [Lachnospiraceae bacterium]